MACVISISSDEEDFEDVNKPVKRIKLDCSDKDNNNGARSNNVIVLDDDEDDTKGRKVIRDKKGEKLDDSKKISIDDLLLNTYAEEQEEKNQYLDIDIESILIKASVECEMMESQNTDVEENCVEKEIKNLDVNKNTNESNLVEDEDEEDSRPSSCTETDDFKNCKQMRELIGICLLQIENADTRSLLKSKIPICKTLFDQVGEEYTKSEVFVKELEEKISLSKKSPFSAVQCFNDIYKLLKAQKKYMSADTSSTTKNSNIIRKLEHTLGKLRKRIKQLEQEEIDFSEEEDSSFLKLVRYQERAVKVFEKLCKYRKEDPHYDSIMYNRLDFSGSRQPEFNKAINRKYKNNMVFPTYYDLEHCLKKCIDSNNMQMSESEFKAEARHCFEKLGKLIQYRRKMDLLDVHSYYVPSNQDPANESPDLTSALKSNYEHAKTKTDEICEKYSRLQETGESINLSSDSDDSNIQQSEDETET